MTRRKVFERDDLRSGSFHITQTDLQAVEEVGRYRLLLADQIRQLAWPRASQRRHAESRLRGLFHLGWLDRQPHLDGALRPRAVYSLGRVGRPHVAHMLNVPIHELGPRPVKERHHDQLFLAHHLATVQAAINLRLAAEALGGQVVHHEDERTLKARHQRQPSAMPVIPDAFLALSVGGRTQSFCIELDRATVDRRPWRQRIKGYANWRKSADFRDHYRNPAVLIVVAADDRVAARRVRELKQIVEEVAAVDPSLFWFTTLDDASPRAVLTQPIWAIAGRGGLYPLINPQRSA